MREDLGGLPYLLALVSVHLYFVSYAMSIVAVPLSMKGDPNWLVGLVVGAFGISGTLSRPLVGVGVDAGNRMTWVRVGAGLTAIAFAGYAFFPNPWLTIVFRLLHGVAMGLFTTAQLAVVAGLVSERRRGLGMGVYQSVNALSQLYGAPLAVALAAWVSFRFSFLVGAAFAAATLLVGLFMTDGRFVKTNLAPVAWRKRAWISRPAVAPALVFLTMTTTIGAVQAFLPAFADERDLGNVGLFYSVYGLALLVSRALSGWLTDRLGRAKVVLPSLAFGSLSLFLIAAANSEAMLLSTAVLYGLAFAAVQVTAIALVVDRTPPDGRGAGVATYTMAWDIGAVAGGIGLGLIIDQTSYGAGFALCGLLPLAGIGLYLRAMRR